MIKPLDFSDLVRRLRKVDRHMVALLGQSMLLWKQIADATGEPPGSAERLNLGTERLREAQGWAVEYGLNPDFVKSLMDLVMDESRKVEPDDLQQPPKNVTEGEMSDLRANLLALTARVAATYDQTFDSHFFATQTYRRFESELIDSVLSGVDDRSSALDLGCATGAYACRLSFLFSRVVGYDISPSMIDYAKQSPREKRREALSFVTADLDDSIPENDSSTAFILMNLGTASEVKDAGVLLEEIHRTLKIGGKAVLSFYNSDALVYKWEFIPWALSLAAEMNTRRNCLDVHIDREVFSIYAKAYSLQEIKDLLPPGLKLIQSVTYPTISSVLPDGLFDGEFIRDSVEDFDHQLNPLQLGNYLLVVCEKS